jgi:hypothetical protein
LVSTNLGKVELVKESESSNGCVIVYVEGESDDLEDEQSMTGYGNRAATEGGNEGELPTEAARKEIETQERWTVTFETNTFYWKLPVLGNLETPLFDMMNQCYMDAIFACLPCMIGENRWEQLGKESQGDYEKMVTRTDEALLLWALDCYWNVVAVSPGLKVDLDGRPMSKPYYITESNTTRKNQGWTDLGKTRYNMYYGQVSMFRKEKYWYGTVWKNNFHSRWVASIRRGRKTSDRNKGVPEPQMCSMDDLE